MGQLNTLADVLNKRGWTATVDGDRMSATADDDKPRISVWLEDGCWDGWWFAEVGCADDEEFIGEDYTPYTALCDVIDCMHEYEHGNRAIIASVVEWYREALLGQEAGR